ncbi:hypothetical protein [Streptomyces griseoloalbus]|uniref:Uncharacterized protein n=1 Tax=Streptomyces griseoloalbus TaxID=67303 RepID=A0A7W8F829_9ACTN|nr:hypothetical protein [Streptomyces albaduncus]MBB5125612.1 hypothetical protein [Streptomyces albaduncus]GGV79658.1 hypothetical protein GCM10010294_50680 [Streptomyces griseoloalbus]GGW56525.1 hypothetical protein GCM10010340_38960 [Streptomyces albaduncus]
MNTPQDHQAGPDGQGPHPERSATAPDTPDGAADATGAEESAGAEDETEHAWDSRRDLYRHSPGIMLGHSARIGGSLVGGDQHGVSGGHVTGDVILGGSKVEYHLGADTEERSGEIPGTEVEALARNFVYPPRDGSGAGADDTAPADGREPDEPWEPGSPFAQALADLRNHRVALLSGPATTGRRAAALMLLRAVGARSYRALDPALPPGRLAGELREGCGHLVADFATSAERPLREHHIRALSERLHATGSHLVLVVGPHPVVHGGVAPVPWQPPAPAALLAGHLRNEDIGGRGVDELLALDEVRSVLAHHRPVADTARFAARVAGYARGTVSLAEIGAFGHYAAERQVREWFDSADHTLHDKAFLIALATFDEAPYPLTAELSDVLFGFLQRIENPGEPARIPVFGTSSAQRVEQALADRYQEPEDTDWGPVLQTKVQFRDRLTAITLLREVWTGHPSARPALVAWLRRLADDPRPVVRTRAAATAAVMAEADLPSAMALLIRSWAADRRLRARLAAANALALAHHLGAPHVSRILAEWCTAPDHRLRWTAVRCYALVGDAFPQEALAALTEAVRGMESRGTPARGWAEERDDLAQSAAALLLAAGQEAAARDDWDAAAGLWDALPRLAHGTTRDFVLRTMVHACGPTDGPAGTGRPLLLDLFARADPRQGTDGAVLRHALAALWRRVLNDPVCSASGLSTMRQWVRAAEDDRGAETALAELMALLVVSAEDHRRLAYLLENLRGEADSAPPAVALRLHTLVSAPHVDARTAAATPSR